MISAEVEPVSGKARVAAARLREIGLTVLHVGATISVEGPKSLWESRFNVSFESDSRNAIRDLDATEESYERAQTDDMELPPVLRDVVVEVTFPAPPEYF